TVRLILSFLGQRDPLIERSLWGLGIAGMIAIGALAAWDEAWFHFAGGAIWLPVMFLTGCLAWARVQPAMRSHPDDLEIGVSYAVVVAVIGAVAHDLLVDLRVLTSYSGRYAPYAAPAAIFGMGWIVLRRFTGAIVRSEEMVATLEQRIDRRREELEHAQARIRDIDRAHIRREEREGAFREIQEGVGARLVSTLAKIEDAGASTETAARAVRAALDELRLMIDSLDPLDGDLLPALAMLRSRIQPRLEAAGVRVEWQVRDLPPIRDLPPSKVLRTLRILKLAMTDAIEREGVRTLTVRTGTDVAPDRSRLVCVEIGDDHGGGSPDRLAEMQRLAGEIGATVEATSTAAGSRIRFTLAAG
ncbi:MAG: hypothetical protein ACREQJ_01210, partial [Candidatus Binatia bacterium]